VVGEKGIGKSTAAKVALAKILRGIVLVCNDEKCNGYKAYRPVVVELGLQSIDKNKLKNFIGEALEGGYLPLFYLDPSKTGHYPERVEELYIPEKFGLYLGEALHSLMEATGAVSLVVLSRDQYKLVKNMLKKKKVKSVTVVDADKVLKDAKLDFVKGVIEKYSGCSGEASSQLAQSIVQEFSDNYAVVAVLAADWLAKGECRVEEVVNAIRQSEKKVEDFVLSYMWFGLLGDSWAERSQNAAKLAPLILATGLLGPFPRKLAEVLLRAFNVHGYENHPAALWLTQDLHGTVLKVLREFAKEAVKCVKGGCDYVGDNPRHIITQMKNFIISHGLGKTNKEIKEILKSKLVKYSINDSVFKAEFVGAVKRCPREFAEAVGITYSITAYLMFHTELFISAKLLMKDLKRCGLAEWLTVEGEMPMFASTFLLMVADKFADLIDPCDIVAKVRNEVANRGIMTIKEALAFSGAIMISNDRLLNCPAKDIVQLLPDVIILTGPLISEPYVILMKRLIEILIKDGLIKEVIILAIFLMGGLLLGNPPLNLERADVILSTITKIEREELSDQDLDRLRSATARVLFLLGHEKEAIQIFRECMKNMSNKGLVGYSKVVISAITADYIASFLAEGREKEAFEEYKKSRVYVSLYPSFHLPLVGLLRIYGLDVADEEVELKRRMYMVEESSVILRLSGVAAALAHLYGLTKEACKAKRLTDNDRAICEALLENIRRPSILRKLLVELGLVEATLLEGVEDPVEMLEIAASTARSTSSLIEIMRLISRGRIEAAKRLAEYWQKELSEQEEVVLAGLFGELVSSLEEGECGERCRKALLKLFYSHV